MYYEHIELTEYFNNKGISPNINYNEADFTGTGSSFPLERFPVEEKVIVNRVPFILNKYSEFDNFELNEQTILVPKKHYSSIHILGAAENGSFKEKIILNPNTNKSFKTFFGFTDWVSEEAEFGEQVGFRFPFIHSSLQQSSLPIPSTLWHYKIKICNNYIESLRFSDNPSMHIFGITLEVIENAQK